VAKHVYNIAADHYNTVDLENPHIPDGQYVIFGDQYSQLHLKTQQIYVKIPNNDSDHYSTLDAEKQQVVDKYGDFLNPPYYNGQRQYYIGVQDYEDFL
jgi:hypothetical protein